MTFPIEVITQLGNVKTTLEGAGVYPTREVIGAFLICSIEGRSSARYLPGL